MNTMKKTETTNLVVESFNTDFERRLNFETLGKNLLNCAELHANKRGFGVDDIIKRNHAWVMARLSIEIFDMPYMFDEYSITTWVEKVYRMFTNRNFSISSTLNGQRPTVIGYARSVWAIIDKETRESIDLENEYGDSLKSYADNELDCPIQPFIRLKSSVNGQQSTTVEMVHKVVASDIDYNGHVNSMKYITYLCDLFSLEYYKTHKLKRVDIAYVSEAYFGDTLTLSREQTDENQYRIEVKNQKNEIIARGMMVFK